MAMHHYRYFRIVCRFNQESEFEVGLLEARSFLHGESGCQARYSALKLYLLIFIARILDSKVEGGIPSLAAAPDGPDTRPRASAKAAPIISSSAIADFLKDGFWAGSVRKHS